MTQSREQFQRTEVGPSLSHLPSHLCQHHIPQQTVDISCLNRPAVTCKNHCPPPLSDPLSSSCPKVENCLRRSENLLAFCISLIVRFPSKLLVLMAFKRQTSDSPLLLPSPSPSGCPNIVHCLSEDAVLHNFAKLKATTTVARSSQMKKGEAQKENVLVASH